ncbi:hypothetical protein [Streptacidiphilus sp. EB129]|uniref:hypothetical protein n=1 Tax=Streptacidiphilus sp. EB129 TaxID=3156262 RepID=UPI003518000C
MLIFFAVSALFMLGCFGLGLVLFADIRGIGSHYAARNRAVVEAATASGQNVGWFLVFGKTRKVGAFLMIFCGLPLLFALVGLIEALAGIS